MADSGEQLVCTPACALGKLTWPHCALRLSAESTESHKVERQTGSQTEMLSDWMDTWLCGTHAAVGGARLCTLTDGWYVN
jgi:hypothetical protein